MAKKYGGKSFSSESDFGLNRNFDPWATSSTPGSDATGPTRGAGAYSADDQEFRRASQGRTDGHDGASDISRDVFGYSAPSGPLLAGGGPVREVGGGSGPQRSKSKSNAQAVKDQTNGGV